MGGRGDQTGLGVPDIQSFERDDVGEGDVLLC